MIFTDHLGALPVATLPGNAIFWPAGVCTARWDDGDWVRRWVWAGCPTAS